MEKTDEKVKMGKIWAIKKPTDLGSYETNRYQEKKK